MNSSNNIKMKVPESNVLRRQIGSTLFNVNILFNPNAKEKLEEKILRLLKNDLQSISQNVNIESLQAGWLSERSSQ